MLLEPADNLNTGDVAIRVATSPVNQVDGPSAGGHEVHARRLLLRLVVGPA